MATFSDIGSFDAVDAHEVGNVGVGSKVLLLDFLGCFGLFVLEILVILRLAPRLTFWSLGHIERYPMNKVYMSN